MSAGLISIPGKRKNPQNGKFTFWGLFFALFSPVTGGNIISYFFLFSAASFNSFKAAANRIEDAEGFPRRILLW